ncbi:serine/threonine-protein kinase [Smaragdicoccus niigatensis]|uniref:serine/threonine-protein kinase n=1 Tax=Smaragdicoccus niigatensis TaxID=359359 RepID=UPI00035FA71F|nr:serine/threonine-protein kinase [Smaragdicoccus niigatensis]
MRALEPGDPTEIGKYRLLGVVGSGGMGRVYLGRSETGRTVAVKVIRPDLADDDNFRARFGHEVSSARRVSGQFTAAVLDADLEAAQPWLATAFVAGMTLTEAVRRFDRLPDLTVTVLADGLARAIHAVHSAGVIHRDLKPSNVILGLDGPRVIDFGIARAADDSVLTASGQLVGSPSFMSPEQVKGERVGPATDIFAWAGVVVYAARGVGPFGEADTMTMLWRVVQEEPDVSKVPYPLRSIVAAALAKDPADRPTIDELVEMLAPLRPESTSGWLPPQILEEVGRRTVGMLDLEHPAAESDTQTAAAIDVETAASKPPTVPKAEPTPVRRSSRMVWPLVALSVVAIAAVALAAWWGTRGSGDGTSGGPAPSGAVGGVWPSTFDGGWKGSATGPNGQYTVEMYLYAGNVGDTVGTSTYVKSNGDTCMRDEDLVSVDGRTAHLQGRLKDGPASCLDDSTTSTITLEGGSTIAWTMPGNSGNITGTLRRQP